MEGELPQVLFSLLSIPTSFGINKGVRCFSRWQSVRKFTPVCKVVVSHSIIEVNSYDGINLKPTGKVNKHGISSCRHVGVQVVENSGHIIDAMENFFVVSD